MPTSTQNLSADAADAISQAQIGLERLREMLVSDYGKVTRTANFARQKVPWTGASVQPVIAINDLTVAFRQNAYNTLIPVAFKSGFCQKGSGLLPFKLNPASIFNKTVGFSALTAASRRVIEGYAMVRPPGSLMAKVVAAPTFQGGDLNGGENPSSLWVQTLQPSVTFSVFESPIPGCPTP